MGYIEDELAEVKKLSEHLIVGCKLVSCVKTMVRADIKRTEHKFLTICIQFPEHYPKDILLLELKSKTLSETLLRRLTAVCEEELKKSLGKPQILSTMRFLRKFLDENPLSCCFDEISNLKKIINIECDEFKTKQKSSSIFLKVHSSKYFLSASIFIPDEYPLVAVEYVLYQKEKEVAG